MKINNDHTIAWQDSGTVKIDTCNGKRIGNHDFMLHSGDTEWSQCPNCGKRLIVKVEINFYESEAWES